MPRVKDTQRYRKIYSYYRPKPVEESLTTTGGVSEEVIQGLDWKQSVIAASISNLTASLPTESSPYPAGSPVVFTLDGVTLEHEDRVLIKDQTTASQNGIYLYYSSSVAGTYWFARALDAEQDTLTAAAAVFVEEGANNADSAFVLTTNDPITVGTTAQTWVKFAGAGSSIFNSSGSYAKTVYNVSFDSSNRYNNAIGSDVFFFVSGSIAKQSGVDRKIAVFGGDLFISGNLTHGTGSTASGLGSHAEGHSSISSGSYSHAEGYSGTASGVYSHAEGASSIASGTGAHAEGSLTTASGDYSHAEGYGTVASGSYSHAEGGSGGPSNTLASGLYSHAEGYNTTASGESSHAEGYVATASGEGAHAEGDTTTASGDHSHAEGFFAVASGNHSHAEGSGAESIGQYSHAEGVSTKAHGDGSHAAGQGAETIGNYSYAGGNSTIASGTYQHVIGVYNAQGNTDSLFVVGNGESDRFGTTRKDILRVNMTDVQVTGSLIATLGLSGSLTKLSDGTSYLVAGTNVTITSASNGQVVISSAGGGGGGGGPSYFDSTTAGSIFTTGSAAFIGGSTSIDAPNDVGTDVFFYVSGTVGSGSFTQNLSLFGGDVVASGSWLMNVVSGTVSGTYAVGLSDHLVVFTYNVVTATLPLAANVGTNIVFKDGTGTASSSPQMLSCSSGLIDGTATYTLPAVNYSAVTVVKVSQPDTWVVI